jgi:hypothetical protein
MKTVEELRDSVMGDAKPPAGMSPELLALWLAKKDRWEEAHEVAQDIDTPLGSRIHGFLHTIEGDLGNAGYWYRRAGCPAIGREETDREWEDIVGHLLDEK